MIPEDQQAASYFAFGETEVSHLKNRCSKLGQAIERIGPYQRKVTPDIFSALCKSIIGQQISVKAAATVFAKFTGTVGEITAENILRRRKRTLQQCGMTMKKVEYIRGIAQAAQSGEIDFQSLHQFDDEEIITRLTMLKGVGVWTVEMLLIFSLQRPNILSFGDLAIRKGLMKLHGHRKMTPSLFERYRKRYSPYGSTASLYLWAISSEE